MAQAAKKAKAPVIGKRQTKAPVVQAKMPGGKTLFTIKFAAVAIPVLTYTAAREEKVELHQYHAKCNCQVRQLRKLLSSLQRAAEGRRA